MSNPEPKKGMKLFNTIIVWDVYCVAETEDAARAAVLNAIRTPSAADDGTVTFEIPSEETALECREERHVRDAWVQAKPFVADDVSDADFERVKGKTTLETLQMLHQKAKPEAAPKKK